MNESTLEEIRYVLSGHDARIAIVYVFNHGMCAQVMANNRKVGPVLIPAREDGQSLGDLLHILGDMVEKSHG